MDAPPGANQGVVGRQSGRHAHFDADEPLVASTPAVGTIATTATVNAAAAGVTVTFKQTEIEALGLKTLRTSHYIGAGRCGYFRPAAEGLDRIKREALRG